MTISDQAVYNFQFQQSQAFQKLKELAKSPPDLSEPGFLTSERLDKMQLEIPNLLKLQYGTEQVDIPILNALQELAQEADVVKQMEQMQAGVIMNQGENRAVLHTAMRVNSDKSNIPKGALDAAQKAQKERNKLKKFLDNIESEHKFTDLILIGIGGSDLGPKALYIALKAYSHPERTIHFISNVDPDDATSVLQKINPKKTIVAIVSKSGNTLETQTNEAFARDFYSQAGIDSNKHFVAVTGEGSPMDNPSKYLESFYIWDFVGGRYSATSMVGGVMLGFALGFDQFEQILKGAHAMDQNALEKDPKKNLSLWSALLGIWNRNFLNYPTFAVIPYSQALSRFPAHLQQCDMESNGKQITRQGQRVQYETGPIIWGEPGTNGQHSFYQLIHQGTDKIPIEFIGFKESQYGKDLDHEKTNSQQKLTANLLAQSLALALGQKDEDPNKTFDGNRPTRLLMAKKLTPYTLGALLAYFENRVAFQGFIWNINSFDQEGVQLGKKLANCILSIMKGKEEQPYPLAETLLNQIQAF